MSNSSKAANSRREFLRVGVVGSLGLTLGDMLAHEARAEQKHYVSKEGVAKSVIQIVLPGGMAHQESWDPKPEAPLEYRGPFGVAKTKLPGVVFSENFRNLAQVADKMTVIRSIAGKEADHGRASYTMFTGYRKSPAIEHPAMGTVVSHEFGPRKDLPPYVAVPNANEYGGTGYLGSQFGPFGLGTDPARSGYQVRDLSLPSGVDDRRFNTRREMRDVVDDHFRYQAGKAEALDAMDEFYRRAYAMISSPEARAAFDISKETAATRAKYGNTDAGPRFLLARRLVEAGVRFVTVSYGGWDMHAGIENAMRRQAPGLDGALAGLIRDLDDRGLLASTIVLVTSEFGRTPKINASAGRDHFPRVFSFAVAGGGFKQGQVYGSSNSTASEPEENPVRVEDVLTTVYHQLGINADKELMAPGNRPIEIIDGGEVVKGLLG
ncbi:MAG: DUF1501 domain-containing protein [Gemmataceae bacterium]|nr:DUF1501 domain-containing protein [Planctomycetia bacterium]MBX3400786.1 DUF1501 domain-containing protein [Gemmataceae bacterium]